jgi:ketosteroid isomerase-like protein
MSMHEISEDGDCVLALWIFDGEGRNGIQVRGKGAHVVSMRDGLARRIEVFGSWDDARDAFGRAQAGSSGEGGIRTLDGG